MSFHYKPLSRLVNRLKTAAGGFHPWKEAIAILTKIQTLSTLATLFSIELAKLVQVQRWNQFSASANCINGEFRAMLNTISGGRWPRLVSINFSLVLAAASLLFVAQSLRANEVAPAAVWDATQANLEGSSKSVNHTEALAGAILTYQVVISNSGAAGAPAVMMTDTLPASLTYQSGSLNVDGGGIWNETDGVITWSGSIMNDNSVVITFQAQITDSLMAGEIITNTAEISGTGSLLLRWAATTIVTDTGPITHTLFLPIVTKPLTAVSLNPVGRPNASNAWIVSWSLAEGLITGYELHESQTPDFAVLTNQVDVGPGTSAVQVTHPASFNNKYYYRIRAFSGDMIGPWSNIQSIVGAYHDDFTDEASGWDLRRTTYLERTVHWYGEGNDAGNLVIIVDDTRDWMIVSPLREAPQLPYVIEYRARVNDPTDLVSGGMVFGGDWNGGPCFDDSSFAGIYQHDDCFNQFYNLNFIYHYPLSLLYERVDELVWCPECGGSPMKRLGFTNNFGPVVSPPQARDWHTYRAEVRAEHIRIFVDGALIAQVNDTQYQHQPYFGVFASADEFKPSIWLFDYFKVTPLD
jgi:uncharacterized repeat protein (TIGR01451 family)